MSVASRTLRLAGGVGALLVCGGAGAAVAADQRPAGAPLRPPVHPAPAAFGAAPSPGATPLVIPPGSSCARGAGGAPASAADPALLPVLRELQRAATPAARRQLLAGLPADERQQITALARRRAAGRVGTACTSAGTGADGVGPAPIAPSVSDAGGDVQPLTFSYVS